ncbi:TPA: hypothetical protein N3D36_004884 [Salmonella enterica subsp. enterica serovar Lehrte]|nr:hypothetical protein [Salmonella enterica subsp. enterica serovar Lehrte]HCM2495651.1 hypothetical protein [Salmonella enterica subsp. enterica serovar Lehrte]
METDLQIQPGDRFVIQCLRRPVYRRAGLSFVGGRNEAQLLGPDSEPVDGVLDVSPDQLASLLADPNLVIKVEAAATDNTTAGLVAGGVLDGVTKPEPDGEDKSPGKNGKGRKK